MSRPTSRIKTTPRIKSWAALVLTCTSLLVACATTPAEAARRELRFSGAQITRQLAPSFPLRRCVFGNLGCAELKNPRVQMKRDDQRLFMDLDVRFEPLPGQGITHGRVQFAGIPAYDPREGAFYLRRPELLDLSVDGIGAAEARQISGLISGMLADQFFSDQPLWTLDESDPRQAMARLTLRGLSVRNGVLVVVMGDEDEPLDESHVIPRDGGAGRDGNAEGARRGSRGGESGEGRGGGARNLQPSRPGEGSSRQERDVPDRQGSSPWQRGTPPAQTPPADGSRNGGGTQGSGPVWL